MRWPDLVASRRRGPGQRGRRAAGQPSTRAARPFALSVCLVLVAQTCQVARGQTEPTNTAFASALALAPEVTREVRFSQAHRATASLEPSPSGLGNTSRGSGTERLAVSMAGAARQNLFESGTETARQALLDCLRGDYPGGGMGALSLPFHRPSARTDHCAR